MSASAIPDTVQPSLTIERRLKASPARVWQAWTDPQQLMHWFGPEGSVVTHAEADLRVGGKMRVIFSIPPDPEVHDANGTYIQLEEERLLSMDWHWITTPDRVSRLSVLLRPDGAGTHLILTHDRFADEAARDGHLQGWTGCLDRLETVLGEAA